jgi:hypothetical protein
MKSGLIRWVSTLDGDNLVIFYLCTSEIWLDNWGGLYMRGTTGFISIYRLNSNILICYIDALYKPCKTPVIRILVYHGGCDHMVVGFTTMQSVPITTNVVTSNLTHGEVYLIEHYVIK